ncbi:MAG: ribonuclease III [Bryobacterales bacterium]|nr:ribonuclease III [Bryobacterales bacterium]
MQGADLAGLEQRLGHRFTNRGLLSRALTHKSHLVEEPGAAPAVPADNEQLEFLGDSILGFLTSDLLLARRPELPEGQLSKLKSHLVSASRLYAVAQNLDLGVYLMLGKGEELSGGRTKRGLLSNAVEAIIAALYLDSGLETCRRFVEERIVGDLDLGQLEKAPVTVDAKSALQEYAQARGMPVPRYTIVRETGPEHAKTFTVEARLGRERVARAEGHSKKDAAQRAARHLLAELKAEPSAS